jgi:hypothetical protein
MTVPRPCGASGSRSARTRLLPCGCGDNHWAWPQNLRSIMAADLIFVSHGSPDHTGYLRTPVALLAGHIAACSAQWARAQAGELGDIVQRAERQHKALINYVDYGFAWSERTRILKSYAADLADADVFLMPPDDRSRYFSLSPMERFAEWCRYKATIVIPIRDDLSTRVFDALLAGLIPIVPHSITDLDRIIPTGDQERLGIVRIDSLELPTAGGCRAGRAATLRRAGNGGHHGPLPLYP